MANFPNTLDSNSNLVDDKIHTDRKIKVFKDFISSKMTWIFIALIIVGIFIST